ncbi:MAG TPA: methyltransferase domain-containing protein [Rhodocyclaceae bacterium]|jgi:SAM-dependent methyltransferase|nr:class I SAM-dependent methyltransferase [Betaproteobacteria bacterium]HMV00655.1 methyltransferase domain-containing protein [Rhodocyclaceae bacterium]HMV19707.1 methyltransferase domain-containing protein [Rhodocyclaceae bacterium]HMW76969.1 methyltransferase domain-containing protein [Rhodocyclaceae bacterium]HNE43761.1 methyltransferase domain-containing protein [Rhodocyclaceae bacterium]
MSGATVGDFLAYWESEGEGYFRRGDYDWMASLVPGTRILEIGCGVGFGTLALAARGLTVLAIDSLAECVESARKKLGGQASVEFRVADVAAPDADTLAAMQAFRPETVVCWLMGAPAETTGALPSDAGQAVAAYRERIHRAVAELAGSLASVRALHLVDRTAIPWQAKDIGRDTLVRYHLGKTLSELPFGAVKDNALYRKLEGNVVDLAQIRRSHPSLKSVVPTLASLLALRKD